MRIIVGLFVLIGIAVAGVFLAFLSYTFWLELADDYTFMRLLKTLFFTLGALGPPIGIYSFFATAIADSDSIGEFFMCLGEELSELGEISSDGGGDGGDGGGGDGGG